MKKIINSILKNIGIAIICGLIIWWAWNEKYIGHASASLQVGTYEVEANDSVYIVTTRIDSVYADTQYREEREMRDN